MRRGIAWLGAALALLLWSAAPAAAQDPNDTGWVIERFDATLLVDEDGTLTVREQIDVDFGVLDKHGIYRVIPVRYAVPGDDAHYRVLEVDGITVESSAPADLEIQRPSLRGGDPNLVLRIGDPDVTVSGKQSYTITYRVRGALNTFDDHEELYWNVTGNGWPVPIRWAHAAVGGGQLTRVACFRGDVGATTLCDDSGLLPGRLPGWFTATELAPGEGLTAVVGFAKGTVQVPPPILVPRWTLARAFTGSPAALPLAAVIALGLAFWLTRLLWREGRDRVAVGGVTSAGVVTADAPLRGFGRPPVVVEFRPPDDLPPALLGLLVDERVDPADVSATIVDLAVRGHLVIEEREGRKILWLGKTEWVLRRTPSPDALSPYEQRLVDALFADGDEVELSSLKGTFATQYALVCSDIEQEAVRRGWFSRRPTDTRRRWAAIGVGAVLAGGGILAAAAWYTTVALAAVPLPLAGLAILIAHRWMPARTAQGSRLTGRAIGFREYIRKAEVDRMEFAEAERLFVAYLPYAVAFGAVDRWARTFAELGVGSAAIGGWYVGSSYGHGMGLDRMSAGLSEFSRLVGATLPVTPASSGSSGFGGGGGSGGGFGGGGGGSW
jgi:hypothetical protein